MASVDDSGMSVEKSVSDWNDATVESGVCSVFSVNVVRIISDSLIAFPSDETFVYSTVAFCTTSLSCAVSDVSCPGAVSSDVVVIASLSSEESERFSTTRIAAVSA